eukprot:gene5630-7774_t
MNVFGFYFPITGIRCHQSVLRRSTELVAISVSNELNDYFKETELKFHTINNDVKSLLRCSVLFFGACISFNNVVFASENMPIAIDLPNISKNIDSQTIGKIDLDINEPEITNICWMDIQIGDSTPQRIEISLYGKTNPITVENFKLLCSSEPNNNQIPSYKGSSIFRIISTFSIQGGNIYPQGTNDLNPSHAGKYGVSAINNNKGFLPENYYISHKYNKAGVVSMMKDVTKKNNQDSRFFITLSPDATWADDKYVAFGRVTKGMDLINGLTIIPVEPPSNYPKTPITIIDSGVY